MPLLTKQETNSFTEKQRNFQKEVLQAHNNYRAQHCVPSLALDDNISRAAQTYAEHLAKVSQFAHSDTSHGENLYLMSSSQSITKLGGKSQRTF